MSLATWLGFAPSSSTGTTRGERAGSKSVRDADRAGHAAVNSRPENYRAITAWHRPESHRGWWRSNF